MLFTKGLRKSFRIAILRSSHHSLHILRHSCLQLQILTFSALLHRLRQGHDWWFLTVSYLLPQVDLPAPAHKNLTMLRTILKNLLPRRSCCSGCCALGRSHWVRLNSFVHLSTLVQISSPVHPFVQISCTNVQGTSFILMPAGLLLYKSFLFSNFSWRLWTWT